MSLPKKEDELFYEEFNKFEEEKKMKYVTSVERIGIKKGKKEGKKEVVLKLLKEGLSLDLISRTTDFSLTEIQGFQSEFTVSKSS